MPSYSKSSAEKLLLTDPRLRAIFELAIEDWDHTIIYGHRTKTDQDDAIAAGNSQKPWPTSEHNKIPSRAVDGAPYYADVPKGGIDWRTDAALLAAAKLGDWDSVKAILENIKRWIAFSGYIRGIAKARGIKIRSGADWDNDQRFNDHTLIDLPHFELVDP